MINLSQAEIARRASKVYIDMYEGDGVKNPSIITRLDRIERVLSKMDKFFWAVILAALAAIGDIVSLHLK